MLIDSHCHLDDPRLAEEGEAVLARAREAGVEFMLTISTTLSGFPALRAIAERHPQVFCTVGVHPHEAAQETEASPETLIALSRHPRVAGIGETGLDYHYMNSPRAAQLALFRIHAAAARMSGLPLVVHSREAEDDTIAVLKEESRKGTLCGVFHCFAGSASLAEAALSLGFHISFSGILTFKGADGLRALAAELPLDRLLVETDAPYLAPVPHRGKRNEPAFVRHTAEALAKLRRLPLEEIGARTSENFRRLFTKAAR
jgi:TatD DNase family protein